MHFKCDKCHFRNIQGRDPCDLSENDTRLLVATRRDNLDAFLSRKPGMIKGNLKMVKRSGHVNRDELGLETWLTNMGH